MIAIFQTKDFIGGELRANGVQPIYRGTFKNLESAEKVLGWVFLNNCCHVIQEEQFRQFGLHAIGGNQRKLYTIR